MSSISILNSMSFNFDNPWLLFVLVPAVGLALIPYFRVPKQHRNTRNRVISLVLHCAILILVVFMLAGLSFTFTHVSLKKDVILLVDASDSAATSKDEMDEFIGSVLDEIDSDHKVGIVTFGGDCIYSAEMSSDPKEVKKQYSEQKQTPVGDATDISSALLYARTVLSSPEDGRIIILSDGRQTDNNAVATVKALSDDGVRIDTVYFPSSGKSVEAQITDVEVQAAGGSADIIVTVDSTVAQTTKLKLYDGDTLVEERRSETLNGGTDIFSFGFGVIDSRMHVIRVEIEPDRDTLAKNNVHYAYVNVNASSKVLLVDGSGNGATDLSSLIDDSFEVTKVTLSQLPTSLEELCEYGEVILLNVANSELPKGFDDMLTEYVESFGGGLYTVGGSKAYQQDDMEGTKLQELLPVNANTDAKSLGLLLVIDSSGSMTEQASGSNATRMELAIEAAVASVNALAPDDYVGVISFNSEATVISEMLQLDRKDDVIRRIRGIKTAIGTHYFKTLELARTMMQGFNATELKHIIFLTDGEPAGEAGIGKDEILTQVDRIARNGTTLSTIALGPSVPTDIVSEMAERGNGRFRDVVRESELIKVMVEETTVAAGQYLNQGEFTPSITGHTPAVSGITELPKLGGFYGTRIKNNATMVLGYDGNPIYAEWKRGEGKVGSFMCDLEGVWSADYFTDKNGAAFIINSINSVISKQEISNQPVSVDFSRDNFTVRAVVRAMLEKNETVFAKLVSPSGEESELSLEKLSAARFAASFKTTEQGVYTVVVTKSAGGENEEYFAYIAFSYSNEYKALADDDACFEFMETLSLEGKGSMLFTADKMFGDENEMTESYSDPTMILLIICSVLFLSDIAVRKFKLKLPDKKKTGRDNG